MNKKKSLEKSVFLQAESSLERNIATLYHIEKASRDSYNAPHPQSPSLKNYSKISRTDLFFILVEAAPRIVLIALAVLPCLPIILPKSSLATLSSITEVCSPSISVTLTSSGLSTSNFAMYSMSSFISVHLLV